MAVGGIRQAEAKAADAAAVGSERGSVIMIWLKP